MTFGSGDSDVFTYDANTSRMTKYQFNVGTTGLSDKGVLTWNANSTLQKLAITDGFPSTTDTQTCTYGYDDMVRIAGANCGSAANQTFTYDPFGNIDKSGSPNSFVPTYSMTRNRISTVGSTTAQYDNNGNVLNDGVHTYAWDADGNSITVDTVGATFDALDRMVEQNRSSVYTEIVYSPTGAKLALMSGTTGQTLQNAFINLPGQATAVYTSSGLDHYRHSDWLGSARLTSSPSQTVLSATAYAPFGETYTTYPNPSASADPSFTGQNSDTVSGEYDFLAREYSTQGRWPEPDPAALRAVNPMNPQSWNRYAYVLNNPLGLLDPLGLDCIYDEGGSAYVITGDCSSGGDNGLYVPGTVTYAQIDANGNLAYGYNDGTGIVSDNVGGFAGWDWSTPDTSLNDTMLGQMMDPSQCPSCPHIFNGAYNMVKVGTAVVTAEATVTAVIVTGPAVLAGYNQAGQVIGAYAETYLPGGAATLTQIPDFIRGFRAAYGEFAQGIPANPAGLLGGAIGSLYKDITH